MPRKEGANGTHVTDYTVSQPGPVVNITPPATGSVTSALKAVGAGVPLDQQSFEPATEVFGSFKNNLTAAEPNRRFGADEIGFGRQYGQSPPSFSD